LRESLAIPAIAPMIVASTTPTIDTFRVLSNPTSNTRA
jgi:hypothetical protein